MNESSPWIDSIAVGISQAWGSLITNAPALLLALLILIVGWLVARLARSAIRHLTNSINSFLDRIFPRGILAVARLSPGAMAIIGELAFWLVIFFTATIALRTAGLLALAEWLGQASSYIPNLLIGFGIIILGYVLSRLAGEQVATHTGATNTGQYALFSRLSQLAIFVSALVIGLDQIGVDVTFLVALFAVTVGASLLGLSIAFALGAQDHVKNLIGARIAQREIINGQSVRIGSVTGNLLEVTRTHLVLDTEEGRTLVPGQNVDSEIVVLITPEAAGGGDGQKNG